MIETVEREIDGFKVEVTQLPAMRALKMSVRLGKLFGPSLTKTLTGLDVSNLGDIDVKAIGAALSTLFEDVTEDEIEKLARDLLGQATLNGADFLKTCDLVLRGHPLAFFKILVFALEVNYQSFFDAFRAAGARQKAKASQLKPPNT